MKRAAVVIDALSGAPVESSTGAPLVRFPASVRGVDTMRVL